jgi:hypothetical protein
MAEELVLPPRWQPRPPTRRVNGGQPFEITVNEINSYLRCRRAWDITSANRKSLQRKGTPAPALHIGAAFHYVVAKHLVDGQDPEEACREFFALSNEKYDQDYFAMVGTLPSNQERQIRTDQMLMVLQLIKTYFGRFGYENSIKPYAHIASELTFRVPLVSDYDIWLIGTIDQVVLDPDGNPVPLERKTYSRRPDKKNWRFNHQIYGYACALSILTGHPVNYALYDGIRKKEPTIPQILKNGSVSRKWIDTSYDIYREVVLATYDGEVPNEYLDILNRFRARDHSPENAFTTRFRVPIFRRAMQNWWNQARVVAMEAAHQPRIIPNFEWQGCPMCRVKDLCYAIQAGDKQAADSIVRMEYRKGVTPTVATVHGGKRIAQRRVADPRHLAKYSQVTLGYDPDYTTDPAPSGD